MVARARAVMLALAVVAAGSGGARADVAPPPLLIDFAWTLRLEGKIKSAEQQQEIDELQQKIDVMLSDWYMECLLREVCPPSRSSDLIAGDPVQRIEQELVQVAHAWDGSGELPDFAGIAEKRMREYDAVFAAQARVGESFWRRLWRGVASRVQALW